MQKQDYNQVMSKRDNPIRILHLEDNPLDADLIRHLIDVSGLACEISWVDTQDRFEVQLAGDAIDLVMCDNELPGYDGDAALELVKARQPATPVIVVSGSISVEEAVRFLKQGAADYVLKNDLSRLSTAVKRAVDEAAERRQLRQAEGALKESERKYRKLFEELKDGIFITSLEGNVIDANPAGVELLGYSAREEILGLNFTRDVYNKAAACAELQRIIRERGYVRNFETEFRRKNGSIIDVIASVTAERNENGEPVAYMGIFRDITASKRNEEILRQTEKLATMGELLAGVAHELNNPLSVIIGRTALLRETIGERHRQKLDMVAEAGQRCARIVKNFLTLARRNPPERQNLFLNQLIKEAVELLAYQLRVDNIQVILDLDNDLPPFSADPGQLHQVVVNLVTNAHHAMQMAPAPKILTLRTRLDRAGNRVSLDVMDTGPGIPTEIQHKIFEPFFTTKPPGEGTGLGLSLCRGIIEEHGGTLRVENQQGGGAVFTVELPVVSATTDSVSPSAEALPSIQRLSILFVDDEIDLAGFVADVLMLDGHTVEIASNGSGAMEKLRGQSFDLILCDMKMPGMDGPAFYRELEQSYPGMARRVIFLTGDMLSPDTREFLERTGTAVLAKPFGPDDIRSVLRQYVQVD